MKSARELFEELGYEQTKTEHFIKYTSKVFISDWHHILFDLKEKIFSSYATSDSPFTPNEPLELTVKELQAINQQINELGWNDTIVNLDVKLDSKKVMEVIERTDKNGIMDKKSR